MKGTWNRPNYGTININKETIVFKNETAGNDDAIINMKHKDGSLKVNISDKKDEEDIILVSKQPIHPREIIKKKTKLLEFDARTLKEIPYINIDVPIDTTESENEMTDRIIQNLPVNNDSYYIDHEEGSNTFPIKEDPK